MEKLCRFLDMRKHMLVLLISGFAVVVTCSALLPATDVVTRPKSRSCPALLPATDVVTRPKSRSSRDASRRSDSRCCRFGTGKENEDSLRKKTELLDLLGQLLNLLNFTTFNFTKMEDC